MASPPTSRRHGRTRRRSCPWSWSVRCGAAKHRRTGRRRRPGVDGSRAAGASPSGTWPTTARPNGPSPAGSATPRPSPRRSSSRCAASLPLDRGGDVGGEPLEEYTAGVDDEAAGTLRDLDAAVRAAAPELELAIKYRMPTYTLERRWRQWVVALSVTKDAVNLRFLWGVLLDDPLRVLRPGTSTLMTWDFPRGADVDTAAVATYVRDALDKRDHFLAHDKEISAAARAKYGGGR